MLLLPVSRYAEMSTRLLIKSLCRYRSSLPPLSLLVDIIWEHYHATSPMTRRRKKTSGINRQEANAKKSWLYKHQFGWLNKIILQYNSPTEHHRFFNSLYYVSINSKAQHPSPLFDNSRAFDFHPCAGGGEFEPCLGKIGNLNRKCHVFPEEYSSFIFDMEVFKEKEFPLASWWLRSKRLQGLNFKAWIVKSVAGKWVESHGRCSCLLQNNWPSNSALGWGILTQFWFRGREFERTNFQMPRGRPGWEDVEAWNRSFHNFALVSFT